MGLKTPNFWYQTKTIGARSKALALTPLSWLYNAGYFLHHKWAPPPYKAAAPVICVGNPVAGGSGKTPTALALMSLIKKKGLYKEPVFLSRGYKGSEKGPLLVDHEKHTAGMVGDEPLLLSLTAKTVIAKNRREGAAFAVKAAGADLVIMDDGLQNPHIFKDLRCTVIDGRYGFGNGKTLPAGPLREKQDKSLAESDAVILIGRDEHGLKDGPLKDKTVFEASITVPDDWIYDHETPYIAFTGIGQPEKFHSTLWEKGLNVVGWHTYPDHHHFTKKDLQRLARLAHDKKARLITTEKDDMRLPPSFKKEVTLDIMPVILEFKEEEALLDFLKNKLSNYKA